MCKIFINKNPLSASGQAPVASESVGAFPVRVALRAVAREKTACSLAGSALRAEWNIGKSECREQPVYCFQDHTGATEIRRRVVRHLFVPLRQFSCLYRCGLDALCCGVICRALEEGRVGGPTLACPRRHVSSSRAVLSLWRSCGRSQMFDLRRFPVSDEFNSYRKTFFVISDRMEILVPVHIILENANFSMKGWKCRKSHSASNGSTLGWQWDLHAVENDS